MISGNSDPDCNAHLHILKPDDFWNIPKKGPHVSKMGGEQGGVLSELKLLYNVFFIP